MPTPPPSWSISVDTGGTFTDCIAISPAGETIIAKVLSTGVVRGKIIACRTSSIDVQWGDLPGGAQLAGMSISTTCGRRAVVQRSASGGRTLWLDGDWVDDGLVGSSVDLSTGEPAPVLAARLVTGTSGLDPLPEMSLRVATTRGTNALLERRVDATAIFVTKGLGDLLVIGDQRRPDLFAIDIIKPEPLWGHVQEIAGRCDANGGEVSPLDVDQIAAAGKRALAMGIDVAAVALMHAWRSPEHERIVADVLRSVGFSHVTCSHEVGSTPRIVPRAQATLVDGCLRGPVGVFLQEIASLMPEGSRDALWVMSSAGGLVESDRFRPNTSLLSGPAGGVVGAVAAGRTHGSTTVISFDMGGTSTDVAWTDGVPGRTSTITIGGIEMATDALAIETVAAGGGSVCEFADGRWSVGPESAGADPGPACYGRGGPLTLTDINLLAGRLESEAFAIPIDVDASWQALSSACATAAQWGSPCTQEEAISGLLAIADQRVAETIRASCAAHGGDPSSATLVAFGGAGGQHACEVATHLGISAIIIPRRASVLSAVGVASAVIEHRESRALLAPLATSVPDLIEAATKMTQTCQSIVASQTRGCVTDPPTVEVSIRLTGQETSFPVMVSIEEITESALTQAFEATFERVYGYPPPSRPLEVEAVTVTVRESTRGPTSSKGATPPQTPSASGMTRSLMGGAWSPTPVYTWRDLEQGDEIAGPALVVDAATTIVIESGWTGSIQEGGDVLLARSDDLVDQRQGGHVEEELFVDALTAIATEMGEVLRRTAISVNVKERLDYSCGILGADAQLLVHAPHMPVHLGAMSPCVKAVLDVTTIECGDVVITNHPRAGGTHLPDISVISGIFDESGARIGFVTSRAHHSELGGMRPGSMPSEATSLIEEGCVVPPVHIVRGGRFDRDTMTAMLQDGPWPSRAMTDNMADIEATIAANQRGIDRVICLLRDRGGADPGTWFSTMAESITRRASQLAREAIIRIGDGIWHAAGCLDDGHPLPVTMTVTGDRIHVDFTGAGGVHPGNLNATEAIVRAAVIYVLRLLIDRPIGLNEGLLDPVTITIPPGSFLSPDFSGGSDHCPAVVGGNTEVSQRLVETMLEALGVCGGSQGTMNNLLLGDDSRTYYETICGGSGASPLGDGTDAVHTHMTNSAMTDPEILEHRLPVRLESFAIRNGSGGAGTHRGGCGVIRRLRVLEPLQVSLLMQGRRRGGVGAAGGGDGAAGEQAIHRSTGRVDVLAGVDGTTAQPGDIIEIRTPGGGGWGPPSTG